MWWRVGVRVGDGMEGGEGVVENWDWHTLVAHVSGNDCTMVL